MARIHMSIDISSVSMTHLHLNLTEQRSVHERLLSAIDEIRSELSG